MPNKEGHKHYYASNHDCFGNPSYGPGGQGGLIPNKTPEPEQPGIRAMPLGWVPKEDK